MLRSVNCARVHKEGRPRRPALSREQGTPRKKAHTYTHTHTHAVGLMQGAATAANALAALAKKVRKQYGKQPLFGSNGAAANPATYPLIGCQNRFLYIETYDSSMHAPLNQRQAPSPKPWARVCCILPRKSARKRPQIPALPYAMQPINALLNFHTQSHRPTGAAIP